LKAFLCFQHPIWIIRLTSSISVSSFSMLEPKYLKRATCSIICFSIFTFKPWSVSFAKFEFHSLFCSYLGWNHVCRRFVFIFLTFHIFVLLTLQPKLYTYAKAFIMALSLVYVQCAQHLEQNQDKKIRHLKTLGAYREISHILVVALLNICGTKNEITKIKKWYEYIIKVLLPQKLKLLLRSMNVN
jgi:hypothetical protein